MSDIGPPPVLDASAPFYQSPPQLDEPAHESGSPSAGYEKPSLHGVALTAGIIEMLLRIKQRTPLGLAITAVAEVGRYNVIDYIESQKDPSSKDHVVHGRLPPELQQNIKAVGDKMMAIIDPKYSEQERAIIIANVIEQAVKTEKANVLQR